VLLTTQYLDEADRLAEIHLCDGQRSEDAVAALTAIASDRPFIQDGSVSIPVAQRRGTIAEAVGRLDDAGIAIDDIAVRTPTLDDVFLNLTGHAAEQEEEE
jgi:ABC-2 type transport system ATP-binding protein